MCQTLEAYAYENACAFRCACACVRTFSLRRKLKIKKTLRIECSGCCFLFLSPIPGILILKYGNHTQLLCSTPSMSKEVTLLPGYLLVSQRERGRPDSRGAGTTGSHPPGLPTSMTPSVYRALCNQLAVNLHKAQS